MTVIINDFEIMVEPQTTTTGNRAKMPEEESEATSHPALRPQDIERIMRHFEDRRSRLVAD